MAAKTNAQVITSLEAQRDTTLEAIAIVQSELGAFATAIAAALATPRVSYTVHGDHGGQTFNHNEYNLYLVAGQKAASQKLLDLMKLLEATQDLLQRLQPFQFISKLV